MPCTSCCQGIIKKRNLLLVSAIMDGATLSSSWFSREWIVVEMLWNHPHFFLFIIWVTILIIIHPSNGSGDMDGGERTRETATWNSPRVEPRIQTALGLPFQPLAYVHLRIVGIGRHLTDGGILARHPSQARKYRSKSRGGFCFVRSFRSSSCAVYNGTTSSN
jgi:hypothetical protein